jgi:hypothetical protein
MEEPMKSYLAIPIALAAIVLGWCAGFSCAGAQTGSVGGDSGLNGAIEQKLELTAAQKSAIYQEVSPDKSTTAKIRFPAVVGADVPPMIELYTLPDDTLAANPAAAFYKYTMVQDQVVLVDPTKMRVIDVIGPTPPQQ